MTYLSSAEMHSDAKNFLSFIEAGVDPRTGTYNFSIPFSRFFNNTLNGPSVPLSLNFDMFRMEDIGLGLNWSIPLSRFDGRARMLYLSNGTSYPATFEKGIFSIPDKKVKDIIVSKNDASDELIIRHKSGLVEVLAPVPGRPNEWIVGGAFSPEGKQTRLRYNPQRCLREVLDDQHNRIMTLDVEGRNDPRIIFWPDNPAEKIVLTLGVNYANHNIKTAPLTHITLSGNVGGKWATLATWRFKYESHPLFGRFSKPDEYVSVISELASPEGSVEKITYQPTFFKLFSDDRDPTRRENGLPAVIAHELIPGGAQPAIKREFSFSSNNYRQLNSGTPIKARGGEFVWLNDYDYTSTETLFCSLGRKRITTRTYNRYHLLTKEVTALDTAVLTTETQYFARPRLSVFDQPANYQLPRRVETSFLDKNTGKVRKEITQTDFDEYGNLLEKISPSGVSESYEYYPVGGADGCPADHIPVVRWLKHKKVAPGSGEQSLPAMVSHYRYKSIKSSDPWGRSFHVIESESLFAAHTMENKGVPLTVSAFDYETDRASRFLGKPTRKVETCDGVDTLFEYRYEWADDLIKTETRRQCMEAVSTSVSWQNALTGNVVKEQDANGVIIATQFDALGRKTLETVAPGTPFQAQKSYSYKPASNAGQLSEELITNALGAVKRILTDGLGRTVRMELEDLDKEHRPMCVIYAAKYDREGQLAEEVNSDWLDGRQTSLTTRYVYDDWGTRTATIGPDGVISHDQYDPVTMTRTFWRNGAGKTVETKNKFDKDDSVERFDRNGKSFGAIRYEYDGWGRCTAKTDREGLRTTYTYDVFGRLRDTRLPDNTLVKKEYVRHSTEDLPVRISVNNYTAGEREYDGLLRVTKLIVGGRTEQFAYEGAQTQPARHVMASGKVIEYKYEPALNNQIVERKVSADPGQTSQFQYNKLHAGLTHASNNASEESQIYSSSGQLASDTFKRSGASAGGQYRYSLNGLSLQYETDDGFTKTVSYDNLLRVKDITRNPMKIDYLYDALGRVRRTVTRDSVTRKIITAELTYDDFDREVKRELTVVVGGGKETLTQKFNLEDKLIERELSNEQGVQLKETFEYDRRGRLWGYACSGPRAPLYLGGKAIRGQTYLYDALDNITRVRTNFAGSRDFNNAFYFYENEDKTQLTRVGYTHAEYAHLNARFTYDLDGNQLSDDQGRQLAYDAMGRLITGTGAAK